PMTCRPAVGLLIALFATPVRAAEPPAEAVEFFEKKVRPVLVQHCYRCHSAESKSLKGGLRLDSRAALLKGGDSGPALVPGAPEKSRLIEAVGFRNAELQMPPKGRLPDAVITDLTTWVKIGAPFPGSAAVSAATGARAAVPAALPGIDLAARKRSHWAWQPV